jgi:hypothetical protein
MSPAFKILCAALVVAGACSYYYFAPPGAPLRRAPDPAPAVDPITSKKLQIFELARTRAADPALVVLYTGINERHFGGGLPPIPVMWDDLTAVDALVGDNYHLQGMTNGALMLVSPALQDDEAELQRTLCHEAVHVKLHDASGGSANHGSLFQGELRRIFEEGCFTAILATSEETAALREWIDKETARLKQDRERLDGERARLDAERADVEQAVAALNERIAAANAQHAGWPGDEEQQALSARRTRALQDSSDFNVALARHNADAVHLNTRVERYRLMAAYPHGVDEEAIARRD